MSLIVRFCKQIYRDSSSGLYTLYNNTRNGYRAGVLSSAIEGLSPAKTFVRATRGATSGITKPISTDIGNALNGTKQAYTRSIKRSNEIGRSNFTKVPYAVAAALKASFVDHTAGTVAGLTTIIPIPMSQLTSYSAAKLIEYFSHFSC